MSILDTGVKNICNVKNVRFGVGAISEVNDIVNGFRHNSQSGRAIFLVDHYFQSKPSNLNAVSPQENDILIYVCSDSEPTTFYVDDLMKKLRAKCSEPSVIVGIGGGVTLDTAKAVSNLYTNLGSAAEYQGWDLVKKQGIPKVGIPTISGTGAEATRTCVLSNYDTGLKLGMNSDYSVFDSIILDPDLTASVPTDQYFYTGMDAYIHCIESLSGRYRNNLGDAYSDMTLELCREIFFSDDMKSKDARSNLMIASYLGGNAIAASYVGLVHPFSAGLSVVLGYHHCIANCIVMLGMSEFYPEYHKEFCRMRDKQNIKIPTGIGKNLSDREHDRLYEATIIHEKPLFNALGDRYREILTRDKVREIFEGI